MPTRATKTATASNGRNTALADYLRDIEAVPEKPRRTGSKSGSQIRKLSAPPVAATGVTLSPILGEIDWDPDGAANEIVRFRVPWALRARFLRNRFVQIVDGFSGTFLGRVSAGPFFKPDAAAAAHGEGLVTGNIEILGELVDDRLVAANARPGPGAQVLAMSNESVGSMLGLHGGMLMGRVAANDDGLWLRIDPENKGILPRNVGIFGTVGAGKTNTSQVLIEEAANNGWAVIVLDVEGEYTEMDEPCGDDFAPQLAAYGRKPEGLADFKVIFPASCASERRGAQPFTLRLADFDADVICELLETTVTERNALLDVLHYFQQKAKVKVETREGADFEVLLDPTPKAKLPFQFNTVLTRARERAPNAGGHLDYMGLINKLARLQQAEIMDQLGMNALDVPQLIKGGRVTVVDVSQANDQIRNLVTADLLRKLFVYKMVHETSAPTLLVLEEAHSFISKERVKTMQATVQMLRNVARRGRKRWFGLAFVSQQPGHLPAEIFELCNTRLVHTVRSLHNLEALMATAGDVDQSQWARCPLLGPGEALVSAPQFRRPVIATMRPAASKRKFVR